MQEWIPRTVVVAILTFFITVIATKIFETPKGMKFWIINCAIIIVLLIFYFQVPEKMQNKHWQAKRYSNPITIGVLQGYYERNSKGKEYKTSRNTPLAWCAYGPDDWINQFDNKELFKATKIYWNKINNKWAVIINPFGEVYLEEDTQNKKTFNKIKTFVKEGGIYVSVAGFPFYYIWDSGLGDILDVIPLKYSPDVRDFRDSLVTENFGLLVVSLGDRPEDRIVYQKAEDNFFGKIVDKDESVSFHRAALKGSKNIIPALISDFNGNVLYPMCAIRYGEGYFIFSFMDLSGKNDDEFKIVIKAIKNFCKYIQK